VEIKIDWFGTGWRYRTGGRVHELRPLRHRWLFIRFNLLPPSDAVRKQKKIFLRIFSVQFSHIKKLHPSGNLKFNYFGTSQSLKLRILMERILLISPKLNFTPSTLGCYGLKPSQQWHDPLLKTDRQVSLQIEESWVEFNFDKGRSCYLSDKFQLKYLMNQTEYTESPLSVDLNRFRLIP